VAKPSGVRPRALICEWGAIREERAKEAVESGGKALCVGGADVEGLAEVEAFIVVEDKVEVE
jgi:hypothetical protein